MSGPIIFTGLGVAALGGLTGQPQIAGPGLALAGAGGVVGIVGGVAQRGAGLLQTAGGASGWSNVGNAFVNLGGGFALRALFGPARVAGYRTVSQRNMDAFQSQTATVVGGTYDALAYLLDSGAQRTSCSTN